MTPRQVKFDTEARERLMQGVEHLSAAVRVTLGPRGRNVMLDGGRGPRSTKDGVSVAREIELEDPFENLGALTLREVASRANEEAGDGTTTAVVLAQAVAREGVRAVGAGLDAMGVKLGIDRAVAAADAAIGALSEPVETPAAIREVALVASNGDHQIAALIAEAYGQVGTDGTVTVEPANAMASELRVTEGISIDRGFLSPHFVTDADRQICELEQPLVLLHDGRIDRLQPLLPLLEEVARSGASLLIVADDVEGEALAALVVNKLQGGLKVAAVKAPGFGDSRRPMMEDLAVLTGTRVIAPDLGTRLESVSTEQLGRADRVRIARDETVLVTSCGDTAALQPRVAAVRAELEAAATDAQRQGLERRLAGLSGGVAVIQVGGSGEAEMGERKDRVDDAVHAVRAALADGVVPGGGVALLRAGAALDRLVPASREEKVGIEAVRQALAAPLRQIADNAGFPGSWVVAKLREQESPDMGFDARSGEFASMSRRGLRDPARVVRAALRAGGSVGALLVTTAAAVASAPDDMPAPDSEAREEP